MTFPEGFWWGTGASSTQCEGAAPASNWSAWEQAGKVPASGDGNGFATRYADDFRRMAELGLPHHRLSIEWARIEPEPGKRDQGEVERYREVLEAAQAAGISPWVCLHHFTLPGWFAVDEGGFQDERARSYYWPRHVDFIAETYGDLVFGWKPVNEPFFHAALGWLIGSGPPGVSDPERFYAELEAIHLANFDAALRLRETGSPVATVHGLMPLFPAEPTPDAEAMTSRTERAMWGCWIEAMRDGTLAVPGRGPIERPEFQEAFDLVGFSYYGAASVRGNGAFGVYPEDARRGPMGYAPWSEGIGIVLHRLAEELPGTPLLVAEHGVGTDDDTWRAEILRDSIDQVAGAIDDGIDVRGFFHWTAVDNYEWSYGYDVQFGLWDGDRTLRTASADVLRAAAGG